VDTNTKSNNDFLIQKLQAQRADHLRDIQRLQENLAKVEQQLKDFGEQT